MKSLLLCTLGCALVLAEANAAPEGQSAAGNLRGVYLATAQGTTSDHSQTVGRLGVRHNGETVSTDQVFQDGDAIQFEVSSSTDGCVYVFHQGPSGKSELLWPNPRYPVDNCIASHVSRLIPDDGTIVFDRETGREQFAVVIAPAGQTPDPAFKQFPSGASSTGTAPAQKPRPSSATDRSNAPQSTELQQQILVRAPQWLQAQSIHKSLDAGARGVSFRPTDGDPYLYFSAAHSKGTSWAVTRFLLRHAPSQAVAPP